MNLEEMLNIQKQFYNKICDIENLTSQQKIEQHKNICLAAQSSLSRLSDCIMYRNHVHYNTTTINEQNILFETIDVFRYCLAQFNLWGFKIDDIENAFDSREKQLSTNFEKTWQNWHGQDVIVVDVDDVLAKFRDGFYNWININYCEMLDVNAKEYFSTKTIGNFSINDLYKKFIDEKQMSMLKPFVNVINDINRLKSDGFWIHILTSRPANDLRCKNDTFSWLKNFCVEFDSIEFASEKYSSLTNLLPFKQNKILCAIDDSPKHAAEYIMHGIPCFVPKKSYNISLKQTDNLIFFDQENDSIYNKIIQEFYEEN